MSEQQSRAETKVSVFFYESTKPPRCPTCFAPTTPLSASLPAPAPDPYFINAAIPTRVMVLLDNTQFHEATPILPDGTYVLKDCVVIRRDEYDAMKKAAESEGY